MNWLKVIQANEEGVVVTDKDDWADRYKLMDVESVSVNIDVVNGRRVVIVIDDSEAKIKVDRRED